MKHIEESEGAFRDKEMKKYLSSFRFPGPEREDIFTLSMAAKSYDQSVYPYYILPDAGLKRLRKKHSAECHRGDAEAEAVQRVQPFQVL